MIHSVEIAFLFMSFIIIITTIISPQSLAITFWTILESTLAVLAFLQFSHFLLVLCSPLSLGKACGGSSCSGTAFTIFSFEIAHVFYYDIIDLSINNNIEYHLVLSMNLIVYPWIYYTIQTTTTTKYKQTKKSRFTSVQAVTPQ